jgi:DNA-binding NarL/FixJ family response regulator
MAAIGIGLFVLDSRLISLYEWEIKKSEGMKVIFRVDDFLNFRAMMAISNPPDIVILFLPNWEDKILDFEFFKKLTSGIKTILVIGQHKEKIVLDVIRMGINGYLVSSDTRQCFIDAINQVIEFGGYISKRIIADFFTTLQYSNQDQIQEKLTFREKEIVKLLCEGLSYKQVAERSYITTFAVNQHLKKIYKKLDIHSKGELISMMLK